jgi:hypothetical protein
MVVRSEFNIITNINTERFAVVYLSESLDNVGPFIIRNIYVVGHCERAG